MLLETRVEHAERSDDAAALVREERICDAVRPREVREHRDGVVADREERVALTREVGGDPLQLDQLRLAVRSPLRAAIEDDDGGPASAGAMDVHRLPVLIGQPHVGERLTDPRTELGLDRHDRSVTLGLSAMDPTYALLTAALPSFAASAVEFVEAMTIVLAVGVTRGWRAPLIGTLAAVATLAVIVGTLGAAIVTLVPEHALKVVVGALLMLFGLRWLRKAILRFAGIIAIHDEEEIYRREVAELRAQGLRRAEFDTVGAVVAYKAVLLEGTEVAFIVIAFGAGGTSQRLKPGRAMILSRSRRPAARIPRSRATASPWRRD